MTDENATPRPSLATFLRGPGPATSPTDAPVATPAAPPVEQIDAAGSLSHDALAAPTVVETEVADEMVEGAEADVVHHDLPAPGPADAEIVVEPETVEVADAIEPAPLDEQARAWIDPEAARREAIAAPSFLRPATAVRAPVPVARWQWGVAAGLAVLLTLQILVADRARLAADAGTRPLVEGLCTVLRCSLPAWREPAAFTMLSREVRPVPGQAGALQVHASFRNDARWAQAWPGLQLSLSDADGRIIGSRVFEPADYLGSEAAAAQLLQPQQSAQVTFRLREPAASTVAYNFEFR